MHIDRLIDQLQQLRATRPGAIVAINTADGPELLDQVEIYNPEGDRAVILLSTLPQLVVEEFQPTYTPEDLAAYKHEEAF